MGRAGAQSLGVISKGCLAGSKAKAAGRLGLRSGEVPRSLGSSLGFPLPGASSPSHLAVPGERGSFSLFLGTRDLGAASVDPLLSPPPTPPLLYARPLQLRLLGVSKLGEEEPLHFRTPRAPFKASSHPPKQPGS